MIGRGESVAIDTAKLNEKNHKYAVFANFDLQKASLRHKKCPRDNPRAFSFCLSFIALFSVDSFYNMAFLAIRNRKINYSHNNVV
jgi:hypothetical protein